LLIVLYGLPGSGRKEFLESLKNENIEFDCYWDFNKENPNDLIDLFSSNIEKNHIITVFTTGFGEILEKCVIGQVFLGIMFPKIIKKVKDQRYNEFFGVDLQYLYDDNPFSKLEENTHIFNINYINYNYNIKDFMNSFNQLSDPLFISAKKDEYMNRLKKENPMIDIEVLKQIGLSPNLN
jgi:hypothetical protein